MQATETTKETRKQYPTSVRCAECGEPVYAVTAGEQRMIEQFPRDGFWLCAKCRRPRRGR